MPAPASDEDVQQAADKIVAAIVATPGYLKPKVTVKDS